MSAGSNHFELMVNRDLAFLAPAFRQAVANAIQACTEQNLDAMVYETYRSQALAASYYQRGRTVKPPFRPVTNASTNLHSWHGFGLAVDVVHKTKFWSPPEGDAWFRQVATIFKQCHCTWGGDWKMADLPHFQWDRCPPSPSDLARQMIEGEGLEAVWRHFEAVDDRAAADPT